MIVTRSHLSEFADMDHAAGCVLLMEKPLTWTSFDVVAKVRGMVSRYNKVKRFKVGHAGTLDPLANGLLIVCIGKATKRITEFMDQEKEYTGTITLGATTASYDLESELEGSYPYDHVTAALIEETLPTFTGEILQRPPIFSAKKVNGKRAFESARAGEGIELALANVVVTRFDIDAAALPDLHFLVRCSKGTYIRSLAHDLGQALGTGAHLSSLRRTAIGPYRVEDACTIEDIQASLSDTRT